MRIFLVFWVFIETEIETVFSLVVQYYGAVAMTTATLRTTRYKRCTNILLSNVATI